MIAIIDGMSGSGKSTSIAKVVQKLKNVGVDATSYKPLRADTTIRYFGAYHWVTLVNSFSKLPRNNVLLIDRGLGTEWLFSPLRGYDATYRAAILTLHKMTKNYFEDQGHVFLEFVLTCSREQQRERGRILYDAQPEDTASNWRDWVCHTSGILIDTTTKPQDEVVTLLTEAILYQIIRS